MARVNSPRILHRADQTFEILAPALHRAGAATTPSAARQVFDKLLPQIAQDIRAVGLPAKLGFPYQAVTVSVSCLRARRDAGLDRRR